MSGSLFVGVQHCGALRCYNGRAVRLLAAVGVAIRSSLGRIELIIQGVNANLQGCNPERHCNHNHAKQYPVERLNRKLALPKKLPGWRGASALFLWLRWWGRDRMRRRIITLAWCGLVSGSRFSSRLVARCFLGCSHTSSLCRGHRLLLVIGYLLLPILAINARLFLKIT